MDVDAVEQGIFFHVQTDERETLWRLDLDHDKARQHHALQGQRPVDREAIGRLAEEGFVEGAFGLQDVDLFHLQQLAQAELLVDPCHGLEFADGATHDPAQQEITPGPILHTERLGGREESAG